MLTAGAAGFCLVAAACYCSLYQRRGSVGGVGAAKSSATELQNAFHDESINPSFGAVDPKGSSGAAPPESEPEPDISFANSHFRKHYEDADTPEYATEMFVQIRKFLRAYARAHGMCDEQKLQACDTFFESLQRETGGHKDVDVVGKLGPTATLLWTSASKLLGVPTAHSKELCSLVNSALRDDIEAAMPSLAIIVHGINTLCVVRRKGLGAGELPFPPAPHCCTYRGGGFDDRFKGFFTVGKKYRVPGFLATSFSEKVADDFIGYSSMKATIKWVIKFDPRGREQMPFRCKHVNLVDKTHVPGEEEYLFAPYSVFTVDEVTWASDPDESHRVVLLACIDNQREPTDLPLCPWY